MATTPDIAVSRSRFVTAPHTASFNGTGSGIDGGLRAETAWRWFVTNSQGQKIHECHGAPFTTYKFTEPGVFFVWLGVRSNTDPQTEEGFSWKSESIIVDDPAPTLTRDYYVDSVNGSDTNGGLTAGDAFATFGKAWTETSSAWVVGNESRIQVARGHTESKATAFLDANLRGRLIIDTFGSGAKPLFTNTGPTTNGSGMFKASSQMGLAVRNLHLEGGHVWNGVDTITDGIVSEVDHDAATVKYWECSITDCEINRCHESFVGRSIGDLDPGNQARVDDCEFLSVTGCVGTDNSAGNVFYTYGKYVFFYGNDWGRWDSENGFRANRRQLFTTIQKEYLHDQPGGTNGGFRVHGDASQWVHVHDCNLYKIVGASFGQHPTASGQAPATDFWITANNIQVVGEGTGISTNTHSILFNDIRRMTFRNNMVSVPGFAIRIQTDNSTNTSVMDDVRIECNSFLSTKVSNFRFILLDRGGSGTITGWSDILHRNNAFLNAANTDGNADGTIGYEFTPRDAVSVLSTSQDYNYMFQAVSTNWVGWFSDSGFSQTTLAQWQTAATPRDANSEDDTTDRTGYVSKVDPYDLSTTAGSRLVGTGTAVPGCDLDFFGRVRVTPHDKGAHNLGATVVPDPPPPPLTEGEPTIGREGFGAGPTANPAQSRERRLSFIGDTGINPTARFALPSADIPVATFPDLDRLIAFRTKLRIVSGANAGLIFCFGNATTAIAAWVDGNALHFRAGNTGTDLATATFTGTATNGLVEPREFDLMFAVSPNDGKVRVWNFGTELARGAASSGSLPAGWAAAAIGAFGKAAPGALPADVTQTGAPVGFSLYEKLIVYHNQKPRHFV